MANVKDTSLNSPDYYAFFDFSLTLLTKSEVCRSLIRHFTHFVKIDYPLEQNITLQFEENVDLGAFFAQMPSSAELKYEVKPSAPGERWAKIYQQGQYIRWLHFQDYGGIVADYQSRRIYSCFVSDIKPDDLVPFIFLIVQPLTRMVNQFHYYFLHAAALSVHGRGIMVTGISGRGKSTSTMALIDGGYPALTDEYSMLRREDNGFFAYTITDWMKISPDAYRRFFSHRQESSLHCEDDLVYLIQKMNPYALDQPLNIEFLFILEQSGQAETRVLPASALDIVPELLPVSTSLHNPRQQELEFELIMDFLRTLRCFRVSFGTDMRLFVQSIEQTVLASQERLL